MAATTQHTSPGGAAPQAGLHDPAAAMAAPPEFCLKWNNYHESLADAFSSFLEGENFLDVSLACDDAVISAHKCVLSACSPLFQEILLKNPCSHPTIVLPGGVQAAHVHRLVAFIYHGEVTVPHHLLPDLIRTADLLKIRGLASESIIPLQQLPPQPLEVQAVITIPEQTGPPDLQEPAAPPPPPPPPELPAPPRRKRSRRDPSDTSPPPPELTAAEPPPPPLLLCRGEPAVGMCPPPQQHHALNMQIPTHHHEAAANHHHRPGLPELSAAAAAAARLEPVVKQEVPPPDDHGAQGEEEQCRSPAPQHQHHQLTTIDGLDLLDPSQLLGYDGSAGASTHRPCPVCNRIMRKRDLSRHMQRVHSSRKHACAHCPLSYGYRLDLRRHLQEKHPGMAGGDSPLSVAGSPSHRTAGDGDGSDYDERSDSNE